MDGLYKHTAFVCRRCGACCGLVHLRQRDYERAKCLAKAIGLPLVRDDFAGRFGKTPMYLPEPMAERIKGMAFEQIMRLSKEELTCPFLLFVGYGEESEAVCRIYAVRPDICRMFEAGNVPGLVCRRGKSK